MRMTNRLALLMAMLAMVVAACDDEPLEDLRDAAAADGGDGDGDGDGDAGEPDASKPDGGDEPVYACETNDDCPGSSQCGPAGVCVDCVNDDGCSGPLRCDVEQNKCVQCLSNDECSNYPTSPHCHPERHACVGCSNDAECEPFGLVCAEDAADNATIPTHELGGACLACIPGENEEERCPNGKACVADFVEGVGCFGAQRGTATTCQRCTTDSECAEGHACVFQLWKSHEVSWFCALKTSAVGGACPAGTPTKVRAKYEESTASWYQDGSGDGAEEFCVPDPTIANCLDLQTFGNNCTADEETSGSCGSVVAEGMHSAICVGPSSSQRCSHSCRTNADCVTSCVGVGERYCDPF